MPGPSPYVRTCLDCLQDFEITEDEQAYFQELAGAVEGSWKLPRRCTECRAARRRERETVGFDDPDVWLTCVDCGEGFLFGGRDRDYFARQGFCRPRRCRPCRSSRSRGW